MLHMALKNNLFIYLAILNKQFKSYGVLKILQIATGKIIIMLC